MFKAKIVACLLTVLCLSGCKTIEERPATVQLVTQYAVLKYSERFPEAERAARMERIRQVAESVRAITSSQEVTIPLLQEAVASELSKANLSAADRLLADGLVQLLVEELRIRLGSGLLSPDQVVQVVQVLDWVVAATHLA